jgi:uncharacterized protein DUF4154
MTRSRAPRAIAAAVLVCALAGAGAARAQPSKPGEYQLKAAYLYNFAKFVAWPPGVPSNRPDGFAICVLGSDPFGPFLDALTASGAVNGKPVVTRRVATIEDAATCAILFIGASESERMKEVLPAVGRGVLTVSDIPEFARRGGMIQFVPEGQRIRFEVNQTVAERAGLTLSSELLKVAVAVRKSPGPAD